MAVVLRPALVGVELLVERVDRALRGGPARGRRRADEDDPVDALGVVRGEEQVALRAEREGDEHRALGAGRVQHRERVGGELVLDVRLGPAAGPSGRCRARRR